MACEYSPQIGVVDFIISVFLVGIFIATAAQKKKQFADTKPQYNYFLTGLIFKLVCTFGFLSIFIFYYKGGDTVSYHQGAVAMKNLFYKSPIQYFDLIFNPITWEKYANYFNGDTCYPPTWMIKKEANFTVIRVASLFQIFLPNAILATNLLIARVAYGGIFKLYDMFCLYFPGREKVLAWGFLFMPSVAFWGSGIMKDTIALTGICWLIVLFHQIFIQKSISIAKIFGLILAIYAIFIVKTYLLLALSPGLIIWFNYERLSSIKSGFVRFFLFPIFGAISIMGILAFYTANSELFGVYGADSVLEEAAKVQQDLVREEAYGANSFDIGRFDPTIAGITSKIPVALFAGLFRPFITESGGSPTMVLAGIENFILFVLFIVALFKRRFVGFFSNIFSHPLLILGFVFTLLLAFSIGLTSANFGALVRYKVPLVPFMVTIILLNIQKPKAEV